MGYRRIVLGTDGSATAAIAQSAALSLASVCGADLHIVCAYGAEGLDRGRASSVLDDAAEAASRAGARPRTEAVAGPPSEAILATARRELADLVVVGNRGLGPARRVRLGDAPDRVSHQAPCDVLVVNSVAREERGDDHPGYGSLLVATDGSATANEATRKAFELAEIAGATVTLIHVGDPLVGAVLLERAGEDRPGGARVETRLEEGNPAERVLAVASELGVDLVVVGNRGLSGARRLLGSVPDRILHGSPTDVLIARTANRLAEELVAGHGGIVELDGRTVAAYRDKDGRLHALSPRCTHMGCTVDWNDAEKTWDCPCHGSRYARDGSVIRGPAKRNLAVDEAEV